MFWYQKKYISNIILIKSLTKFNLFHIEIICFKCKVLEQNNYFKQASHIFKNFLRKNLIFVNKKIPNDSLFIYCLVLWIRNMKKYYGSNFYNLELLKLIYVLLKDLKTNIRINFIIVQVLLYSILKVYTMKNSKKTSVFFLNLCGSIKEPYFIKMIKTVSQINVLNLNILKIDNFLNIFNVYNKWFKIFGICLQENKKFCSILSQKNFLYNYFFRSKESYNIFARNPRLKFLFYTKLAKIKKLNGFLSESLNMYRNIVEISSENLDAILIVKHICIKFSKKKKTLKIFGEYLKKKIRKKLNLSKKKNFHPIKLKNLMNKAEEFFQEKKLIGLCRLCLLILSIIFQKYAFYYNNNQFFFKKIYISDFKIPNNNYLNRKNFNSQEFMNIQIENYYNKKNNFFFEDLVDIIFNFIYNNQIIFSDKKISFFVLNRFSFLKARIKLKFILLLLTIKKKKYKKAYEYARILCLEKPNNLLPWYFLSKIEKQVGFAASKTLRFTLRLLKKYTNSIPAMVFAANHCSIFGSHGYALAEYFQSYRWKKNSSFLNFSIYLQYLHKSINRADQNPEYTIILSLCFFFNYKIIRMFTSESFLKRSNKSISLKMEIFFNKAKLYLFLELKSLALITFIRVLKQKNFLLTVCKRNRRFRLNQMNSLKNDSLLNIQILYLNSGNKILSNETIKKIYF